MSPNIDDVLHLLRLLRERDEMKQENYVEVERLDSLTDSSAQHSGARSWSGEGNDPKYPKMGSAQRSFMRNVPLEETRPRGVPGTPDPGMVSKELLHLAGEKQTLAEGPNFLAAAWIQFQVHDWFDHKTKDEPVAPLGIRATQESSRKALDGTTILYDNPQGHWWDASQLYGTTEERSKSLREERTVDGETTLMAELALPIDGDAQEPLLQTDGKRELTGFNKNWWFGLSTLHTLFSREHNKIVAQLRSAGQCADEEDLFQHARLVNAALIAKIHTVEWTPAMVADPALQLGLYLDWWGINLDTIRQSVQRLMQPPEAQRAKAVRDALRAVAGTLRPLLEEGRPPRRREPSEREHARNGSDLNYAMSEEFVAVYRMHALLPEEFDLRNDSGVKTYNLKDAIFDETRKVVEDHGIGNLLASLGLGAPAALRLHNYPPTLTELRDDPFDPDDPGAGRRDLGAIDIVRDRERGIPRYLAFKRSVRRLRGPRGPAARELKTFTDICGDPDEPFIPSAEKDRRQRDAASLAAVYDSPEDVDLLVGMLAEPLPEGMAFSWTAFEIFLLMAPLRLNADWFYTEGFTEEVYTKDGIEWIQSRTMGDVLLEHYPELSSLLVPGANPFLRSSWKAS